ncbi:MAG: glutathione S-transferase [Gammaproteobacteria bacterium]|nr:MAG: glutathione S-transferase [Gammaproteobacteria bacterium]
MKLYGMGKSRSFRALWALEESGIDYEYVEIKFGSDGENGAASTEYRQLNTQGKVPTLVDDDLVMNESGAMLNYIASNSANLDLIPSNNLKTRAKYDEMICFILSDLEQGLWTNGKHRFALPEAQRVPDILPTATWEFNKAIEALKNNFDGTSESGFVVGENFTMADVLLAHTLNWAESFKFDVPESLLTYKNKMYYRSACKRAIVALDEKSK